MAAADTMERQQKALTGNKSRPALLTSRERHHGDGAIPCQRGWVPSDGQLEGAACLQTQQKRRDAQLDRKY